MDYAISMLLTHYGFSLETVQTMTISEVTNCINKLAIYKGYSIDREIKEDGLNEFGFKKYKYGNKITFKIEFEDR